MRALLTMLGIIIGVAAVIVMLSISAGTKAAIEDQITSLGSNLVYVTSGFQRAFGSRSSGGVPVSRSSGGGLVYDDAFAIAENVNGVEAVVVEQPSSQTVRGGVTTIEGVAILGTTADFPSVRDITIQSGRYFNPNEIENTSKVAVLGASLAKELFGDGVAVGQTITVGDNTKLVVIGVFEEKGLVSGSNLDSQLYTPITVVFQKFTPSQFARFIGNNVNIIYVELQEDADLEDVTLQIELLLSRRHNVTLDSADFAITTQTDVIQTQEATTSAFRNLLAWVAGVSLIVGGIGVMNIMLVSVTERTREIGIRQSIGATPDDIRWQFLTEALMLCMVGGLIGIAAGIGGSFAYGQLSDMPTVVVPASIPLAFGSSALVGAFFGFYPASQASKLDPIEALRHE
jgi:putative ABC transport system permease protein